MDGHGTARRLCGSMAESIPRFCPFGLTITGSKVLVICPDEYRIRSKSNRLREEPRHRPIGPWAYSAVDGGGAERKPICRSWPDA